LGCLYAFEAQQPHTTASKKTGLAQHYSALNADETYFEIHMNDEEEPQLLLQKIEMLSPDEKLKAVVACKKTCEALWNALSGIMGEEQCMN
jgi:pyrroloquinoline quinone (PQQ) biosynthesis protein C